MHTPSASNQQHWGRVLTNRTPSHQDPKSVMGLGFLTPAALCMHPRISTVRTTLPLPSLLVPLHSVFRAVFFIFFYLQFFSWCLSAIDKLYRPRRSGLVCPRKTRASRVLPCPLRYSSLQGRSNSVHLPCNSTRPDGDPQEDLSALCLPSHPSYIEPKSPSLSTHSHCLSFITTHFLISFIFCRLGDLWSVQWICYNLLLACSYLYTITFSPPPPPPPWCSMPRPSTRVARCTPIDFPPPRRKPSPKLGGIS